MADVPRTRVSAGVAGGQPTGVQDPEARRLIAELQAEIAALKAQAVTVPAMDATAPVTSPMRALPAVAPVTWPDKPMLVAQCRNVGLDVIGRYEPVVLVGPDMDVSDPRMTSLPLFDCMQAGSGPVPFAVALDDIAVDAIGKVCVGGLCLVCGDGDGAYASYNPAIDPYNVVFGEEGTGEVVWSGNQIGLVRFPTGNGGGGLDYPYLTYSVSEFDPLWATAGVGELMMYQGVGGIHGTAVVEGYYYKGGSGWVGFMTRRYAASVGEIAAMDGYDGLAVCYDGLQGRLYWRTHFTTTPICITHLE